MLRYKPYVTRSLEEDGTLLVSKVPGFDRAPWDIYSNPYSRKSEMRRPTFFEAMEVCAALQRGVDEERLTFRFDDAIVILDRVLRKVEGKPMLPEFSERED